MAASSSTTGMRTRFAQSLVEETLSDTPITVIQGGRQVGKSTLARAVAGPKAHVVSLDAAANYNAARADPDAFVRQADNLLVIDEVQRAPGLIRALKDAVEEDRRPGRFLITRSANLLEIPGTEESLAGRAETVVLYGLSRGELTGQQEDFTDRLLAGDGKALGGRTGTLKRQEYLDIICAGSYPEPLNRQGRRRNAWFNNHIGRIMTRDVQDLSRLRHLDRLPDLLRLLAANTSGELVKVRFAQDSGIPESSLTPYLDLLQTLYLIQQLPAWGDNLTKRVTGRPKVSLLDTGLAARLNHVTPAAMALGSVSQAAGGLLESFVAGELRRQLVWADTPARLFHFRDRDGLEVDIVLESDDRRVAGVEMKAAGSVSNGESRACASYGKSSRIASRLASCSTREPRRPLFGDRLWGLSYSALWT